MKSFKERLKQPPLTNEQARQMAEHTFAQLDECKRRITVLTAMLDIVYPLLPEATQIQLQAMAMKEAPSGEVLL